MIQLPPRERRVRLAIREITITAASALEARRLADAMPPALDRAFARSAGGPQPGPSPRQRAADRVAAQIARVVAERLERAP